MISRQPISNLLLGLCLLLTACATPEPIPEDQFYRLVSPGEPVRLANPAIKGTLKVEPIKTFGIYRERAILFSHSDQPESLKQHHYNHWIDTPTRLIRDQLVDYLRARGVAGTVAGAQIGLNGDIRLYLELKNFERVIHPTDDVSVKVRLDAVITDKSNRPLKITSYLSEIPAGESSVAASVAAINQALSEIYRRLADDLTAL
jgi:ABC-type uncharacterized transport system auxiliary subunit